MGNETSTTGRTGITAQEIAVLQANTNFSEADIRANYAEFQRECPSGKMNKVQFRKFFQQFADSNNQNGLAADKIFTIFDQNKDGTMNFSEFVIACGVVLNGDLNSQLELAFSMIDSSGDGSINFQEMVKFLEFAKQLSAEGQDVDPKTAATVIFGIFNLDRNQKMNKKQFIDGVKNNNDLKQMFSGLGKS